MTYKSDSKAPPTASVGGDDDDDDDEWGAVQNALAIAAPVAKMAVDLGVFPLKTVWRAAVSAERATLDIRGKADALLKVGGGIMLAGVALGGITVINIHTIAVLNGAIANDTFAGQTVLAAAVFSSNVNPNLGSSIAAFAGAFVGDERSLTVAGIDGKRVELRSRDIKPDMAHTEAYLDKAMLADVLSAVVEGYHDREAVMEALLAVLPGGPASDESRKRGWGAVPHLLRLPFTESPRDKGLATINKFLRDRWEEQRLTTSVRGNTTTAVAQFDADAEFTLTAEEFVREIAKRAFRVYFSKGGHPAAAAQAAREGWVPIYGGPTMRFFQASATQYIFKRALSSVWGQEESFRAAGLSLPIDAVDASHFFNIPAAGESAEAKEAETHDATSGAALARVEPQSTARDKAAADAKSAVASRQSRSGVPAATAAASYAAAQDAVVNLFAGPSGGALISGLGALQPFVNPDPHAIAALQAQHEREIEALKAMHKKARENEDRAKREQAAETKEEAAAEKEETKTEEADKEGEKTATSAEETPNFSDEVYDVLHNAIDANMASTGLAEFGAHALKLTALGTVATVSFGALLPAVASTIATELYFAYNEHTTLTDRAQELLGFRSRLLAKVETFTGTPEKLALDPDASGALGK